MRAWRTKPWWVRIATALAALLTVLVPAYVVVRVAFVGVYSIPSESMEPTIHIGDHILTRKGADPERGHVFALHPPAAATGDADGVGPDGLCGARQGRGEACARPVAQRSDATFVERLVAGPGDRVAVVNNRVVLNGRALEEPYINARCDLGEPANFPATITVPADHWFALGDNRDCSQDSRFWGPVPSAWVLGRVIGH